jgi:hypothetical protein
VCVRHPRLAGAYRVPILIASGHGDAAAAVAVTVKNVIIPVRNIAATTIVAGVVKSVTRTTKFAAAAAIAAMLFVRPAKMANAFRDVLTAGSAVTATAATRICVKLALMEYVKCVMVT